MTTERNIEVGERLSISVNDFEATGQAFEKGPWRREAAGLWFITPQLKEAPGMCSSTGASSATRPATSSLGDGAWGLGAY